MSLITPLSPLKLRNPTRSPGPQVRRYLPKTIHKTHTWNTAPVERETPTFRPPAASSQPIATASTISSSTQRTRPQLRKSHSDLYSGASEDEYAPPAKKTAPRKPRAKQTGKGSGTVSKPTKKTPGSNKRKAYPQLADIPEEDEEEEQDGGNQSQSAKKSVTHSSKGKKSTKTVLPDTPEQQQQQPASVNEPVRKQPASSKKAKTTKAKATKAKTAEKAPAAARGKKRVVQEEETEEDLAQPKQVAKTSASGKGKKRTAQEDEPSEDVSQPPQKRAKRSEQEEKSNGEKSINKRPRDEDVQDEDDVHKKEPKRKKLSKSEVPAKKVPKGATSAKSKAGTKAVTAKKARKLTSTAYVFLFFCGTFNNSSSTLGNGKKTHFRPKKLRSVYNQFCPCTYP